ncbi:MAG: hypothetical protein Q8S12_10985 [Hydrogenophaga sp.]|uniref:hypothetical protein n=1 Tax=Hydrogenophaga sp. TaxID=1904254 RepID=UPI0027362203|nr:hypothetical protein [Hydrogenophaga sp.]MDP3627115.1 hypothetical protein [Hydrogenophaga sp.]
MPAPLYGLGISEVDDLVWLTDTAGQIVFTGTAAQLLASAALIACLTTRQRAALPSITA